jgi:hypothetical protein
MDVGVFGPFARAWTEHVEEVTEETGTGIPEWKFVSKYMSVCEKAVTVPVILGGWAKSGLEPFNPNIFTNANYAPSWATSTKVFLPLLFPASSLPEDNTTTTTQGNSAFDIWDILHTSNLQVHKDASNLEDLDGIKTMSDVEGKVEAQRASAFAPAKPSSVCWLHCTTSASIVGHDETGLELDSPSGDSSNSHVVILGQASDVATWLDTETHMDGSLGEDEELLWQQAYENPAQIDIVTPRTQADDGGEDDVLRNREEEDRFWTGSECYKTSKVN